MSNEVYKNGLTKCQSEKAREILIKASVRRVARKIGTSDTAIHNVLRGISPNIKLLEDALKEANKIISKREKLIQNLPL